MTTYMQYLWKEKRNLVCCSRQHKSYFYLDAKEIYASLNLIIYTGLNIFYIVISQNLGWALSRLYSGALYLKFYVLFANIAKWNTDQTRDKVLVTINDDNCIPTLDIS